VCENLTLKFSHTLQPPKLYSQLDLGRRAASSWAVPDISSLYPKSAKSSESPREFEVIAVQGYRSWCQSETYVRLPISNFGHISYRF